MFRIRSTVRVLRREPFVGMFVPRQHQVRMRRVKILPQRFQLRVHGVRLENAAAKKRMMAVSQNATARMLREVRLQPNFLG
jgi:hypothetical protein